MFEIKRRVLIAAKNRINAAQKNRSAERKCVAADKESPIPVPAATYAAMHKGHFGSNIRNALGISQPASAPIRRAILFPIFSDVTGTGLMFSFRFLFRH